MDAIEKRAREVLARMEKAKRNERGHWCDARAAVDSACDVLPAIIAALTPPEGYVAAPEDPSLAMTVAGQLFGLTANQACAVYQSMLAARPEVKP